MITCDVLIDGLSANAPLYAIPLTGYNDAQSGSYVLEYADLGFYEASMRLLWVSVGLLWVSVALVELVSIVSPGSLDYGPPVKTIW